MLYHYPKLSNFDWLIIRGPGPGLGNLLFPISRAVIAQKNLGGKFIYPTFRQIKLGPFLRRESDKRTYGDIFRSRKASEYTDLLKAKFSSKVDEGVFTEDALSNTCIIYSGLRNYFHDIQPYKSIISEWITDNSNCIIENLDPIDIGIHFRQGDFEPSNSKNVDGNIQLPPDWYGKATLMAVDLLNIKNPNIVIFSDGNAKQLLGSLSKYSNKISIDKSKSALTGILRLSKSKVIICSRSTFSMWSVFLGNTIAFWEKNYDISAKFEVRSDLDYFI